MVIDKNWLIEEIDMAENIATSYEEKAFFQELKLVAKEQMKRIEQAEGELDGSLWSPKKW